MGGVLIVDNDCTRATQLLKRLRQIGLEATTAATAETAAAIVFRLRPEAIVLHVDLPRYTGLEFHECLRTTRRGREIPVIYLCQNDDWLCRESAMDQEAAAFLAGPLNEKEILKAIVDVIARHRNCGVHATHATRPRG